MRIQLARDSVVLSLTALHSHASTRPVHTPMIWRSAGKASSDAIASRWSSDLSLARSSIRQGGVSGEHFAGATR